MRFLNSFKLTFFLNVFYMRLKMENFFPRATFLKLIYTFRYSKKAF
jgi:hypothetical protein